MKALVIHAAKLTERGDHIDRMLHAIGMDYEFISEGDADALTDELLDRFLADEATLKKLMEEVANQGKKK